MKFSVVIPIHNKLPHLDRSIKSVLNQSFLDFEIILVDDASTDGSSEKIKEFNDPRIRIYTRTKPGPGGYAARNLGMNKARGDWIAFLDADDEWYSNHLEKMAEFTSNDQEINFLSCGWEISENGTKRECDFYKKNKHQSILVNLSNYLSTMIKSNNPIWTSVVCIKKKAISDNNFFPVNKDAKRGGDSYAWLQFLINGEKLQWSNHIGAIYYIDSINRVTKNTVGEFTLFNKVEYIKLSTTLHKTDKILLAKYFNIKMFQYWKLNRKQFISSNLFRNNIIFENNYINGIILYLISFIPPYIFIPKIIRNLNNFIFKINSRSEASKINKKDMV